MYSISPTQNANFTKSNNDTLGRQFLFFVTIQYGTGCWKYGQVYHHPISFSHPQMGRQDSECKKEEQNMVREVISSVASDMGHTFICSPFKFPASWLQQPPSTLLLQSTKYSNYHIKWRSTHTWHKRILQRTKEEVLVIHHTTKTDTTKLYTIILTSFFHPGMG